MIKLLYLKEKSVKNKLHSHNYFFNISHILSFNVYQNILHRIKYSLPIIFLQLPYSYF